MRLYVALLLALLASTAPVAASTGGPAMPWDSGMEALSNNVIGRLAPTLTLLALAGAGFAFFQAEAGSGVRKILGVVVGGCCAIFAPTMLDALGMSGAVL